MESLNDRLVAEREARCLTARLGRVQEKLAMKLRRAAARIYEADNDVWSTQEVSAVSALGAQANAALNKAADYVERIDAKAIKVDVTRQVQRNPGASLLIAGTAGFILSSMFRHR